MHSSLPHNIVSQSNPLGLSPSLNKFSVYSHISPTKLPSGNFSLITKGTELELRPSSPHRYSTGSQSPDPRHSHCRSSTISSALSRFIPATEQISIEIIQTSEVEEESLSSEISEIISNLSLEDEPEHFAAYGSGYSFIRNSNCPNLDCALVSAASSPQDARLSTLHSTSSNVCKNNIQDLQDKKRHMESWRMRNNIKIETCIAKQNNYAEKYTHSEFIDLEENVINKGL